MIAYVDEFILYDDMQYTRRDWRNRNIIKTPKGAQWLTIPVKTKGKYYQRIRDTEINGREWAINHWQTLTQNYCRSPYFEAISEWLAPLYLDAPYTHLSQVNRRFINAICNHLQIETTISNSWDYQSTSGKTERLASLCAQAGGAEYVTGPAARDYIDESIFLSMGIKLTWFDYSGYPEYPQLWGDFTHGVTILDLLFNCGKDLSRYMKHLVS